MREPNIVYWRQRREILEKLHNGEGRNGLPGEFLFAFDRALEKDIVLDVNVLSHYLLGGSPEMTKDPWSYRPGDDDDFARLGRYFARLVLYKRKRGDLK